LLQSWTIDYDCDFYCLVIVFVIVEARDQWGLMPCEDILWSGVDHCCEVMLDVVFESTSKECSSEV
jgi:hypothetical protein